MSTMVICPNKDQVFTGVKEGTKLKAYYKIVNDGFAPVIISQVSTWCGCTVGKFSKDPIPPNGSSEVELIFDSTNRKGVILKGATVHGTFQPHITLTLKVEVI